MRFNYTYSVIQSVLQYFVHVCLPTIICVVFWHTVHVSVVFAADTGTPKKKIVIIGAGLAGLTCAYRLKQHNIKCSVYDARARAGGRVWSARAHGAIVELGGQNLNDGGAATYIRALIEELGLSTVTYTRQPATLLAYQGQIINIQEQVHALCEKPEALKTSLENLAQSYTNMESILQALFAQNELLRIAYTVRLAAYEGAAPIQLASTYSATLYHQLTGTLCAAHATIGDTPQAISFSQVQGGNARIIDMLMEHLQGDVHLNSPLRALKRLESGEYVLTFLDGTSIMADMVILAIPCPVFSDLSIDNAVINAKKVVDIARITYGTNGKILYPAIAQQPNQCAIVTPRSILWYDEHISSITLAYVKEYGIFDQDTVTELIQPELALINSFYNVPVAMDPIKKPYDAQFVEYNGPIAYSWASDPYAKGSYSCVGVGQEELFTSMTTYANEPVKQLFAPLNDSLFFAGEHTSILLDACGTLEAAVESGERTARMIIQIQKEGGSPV